MPSSATSRRRRAPHRSGRPCCARGHRRLVEQLATDESVFTRHEDTGTYRIDAIDLTIDQIKTGTYRIKTDDPPVGRHHDQMDAGARARRLAGAHRDRDALSGTKNEFLIDATLDAYEGEKRVYTQLWDSADQARPGVTARPPE